MVLAPAPEGQSLSVLTHEGGDVVVSSPTRRLRVKRRSVSATIEERHAHITYCSSKRTESWGRTTSYTTPVFVTNVI